jgi:hypothetical protein
MDAAHAGTSLGKSRAVDDAMGASMKNLKVF